MTIVFNSFCRYKAFMPAPCIMISGLRRKGAEKLGCAKGMPERRGVRYLAVAVEDHELFYAAFAGEIPAGQYGAGRVEIWDTGAFEEASWTAGKIVVVLRGKNSTADSACCALKSR